MLVTLRTRLALAYRRQRKKLLNLGYEEITCTSGIGNLWELDRGRRRGWRITDAVVGESGLSVYVKVSPPTLNE